MIENIVNLILTKCMLLKEDFKNSNELEDEINNSQTLKLERINQELDFTPRQIGLAMIDRFARVSTETTLPLIKKLVNNVVSGSLNSLQYEVKDNIISILIGMPNTLRSAGIRDYTKYFNIYPVLEWINQQSQVEQKLKRRFPTLIGAWFDLIEDNVKPQLFELLVGLLSDQDQTLQFQVFETMGKFIQHANSGSINVAAVYEKSAPSIVSLVSHLDEDTNKFKLVSCLFKMILKMLRLKQLDVQKHLAYLDLDALLKEYSFILSGRLFDIAKEIILAFDFGEEMPELYLFSAKLLHKCLPKVNRDDDGWIRFWAFVAKEIPNTPRNKAVIDELVNMLGSKIKPFATSQDYTQNKVILHLVDEMLLLRQDLPFE